MKKKPYLYYVLWRPNQNAEYPWWKDEYVKAPKTNAFRLCDAKLFNSSQEAQDYKSKYELKSFLVKEIDAREECLSDSGCDDCSWSGFCPRHPHGYGGY